MAALWGELKTLFWLQGKLTLAMFRQKSAEGWMRIGQMLLAVFQLVFTFPMALAMGAGLAVGLAMLSSRAAFELAMLVNAGMGLIWLLLPSSYSGQMVERFEMSRLFPYPISLRGIVIGSTLIATFSMTGLWTIPILLGEMVGLAWHAPLSLPLILLGALPTYALLVLSGRVMEDLFDLVAGDRRLRNVMLAILVAPFMLLAFVQPIIQAVTRNFEDTSALDRLIGLEIAERLEQVTGPSEFLEVLAPSRLLKWLPVGWGTAGMGLGGQGEWGQALGFLALALVVVGALLWLHAGIARRLMQGVTVTIGAERVRSQGLGEVRLPGPSALWTLVRKDWIHLFRNPMPRRLLLSFAIMAISMIPALGSVGKGEAPSQIMAALPILVASFLIVIVSMVLNMTLTGDYFGVIDREGLGTLALSPVDRRYVLLSANLLVGLYKLATLMVLLPIIAILSGEWLIWPLGLVLGLALQVSCAPAYNLAAIIGPYRAQLKFQGRQRGSLWAFIGLLASPPVLLLILLPYIYSRGWLWLTAPLALGYGAAVYGLTLGPLARLLQRREHRILAAVTKEE
mgnify:CR=1 FL=1